MPKKKSNPATSPATHIMLDLETLSTNTNAAIISIGAVEFDLLGVQTRKGFHVTIDANDAIEKGAHVDSDTIKWWMQQSDAARSAFDGGDAYSEVEALELFREWLHKTEADTPKPIRMWGNGSDFDNVILASAYKRHGLDTPWSFYHNRCYRTLKSLYSDVKMRKTGVAHNALHDAVRQAHHLLKIIDVKNIPLQ